MILRIYNKLQKILSFKEKIIILIYFFSSLLSVLVESVGLSSVVSIFSILSDKKNIIEIEIFNFQIPNFLIDFTIEDRIAIISHFLIILFIIRLFLQILINYIKTNFIFTVTFGIQSRLIKNFLSLNLQKYQISGTKIIRNIESDSGLLKSTTIGPFLDILSEILLLSFFISFLLIYDPKITFLSFFIISFFSFYLYFFTKPKIQNLAEKRTKIVNQQIKHVIQIVKNFFDIKINLQGEKFYNYFNYFNKENLNISKKYTFITSNTRPLIEFLILVLLISFIYFLSKNYDSDYILNTLALYIVAFYKLGPSFVKIVTSFQNLKLGEKILDNIIEGLKTNNIKKSLTSSQKIVKFQSLKLENIQYKYPGTKKPLIKNFNLHLKNREKLAIFGPSGSGKTTLLNIIFGLLKPDFGKVLLNNKLTNLDNLNWHKKIGYVGQSSFLFEDTIKNNITFGKKLDHKEEKYLHRLIKFFFIKDFTKKNKQGIKYFLGETNLNKISGGEKQRLLLARALFKKPEILILDESLNAIDKIKQKKIIKNLKLLCKNTTIIFITHDKSNLSLCNKIIYLKKN